MLMTIVSITFFAGFGGYHAYQEHKKGNKNKALGVAVGALAAIVLLNFRAFIGG